MAGTYQRSKGRSSSDGGYFGIPKEVMRHPNFIKLRPYAIKLLVDLGEQFLGKNNGDLCATWSFMKKRGWRAKETLNESLKELMHYGLIVQTQFGGLNRPTLYAFTWLRVDKAQRETGLSSGDRLNDWKQTKSLYEKQNTKKRADRKKRQELKKTQVRLPIQRGTANDAVTSKIKVVK